MMTQSVRAAAGRRTITTRFVLPLSKGSSHAPAIRTAPGCTHSGVIVVFRTHEPQLPEKLRDDNDQDTGDQTVDGAPGWNVLEPEMSVLGAEEGRQGDLRERQRGQGSVTPARHASHFLQGSTRPASASTGS